MLCSGLGVNGAGAKRVLLVSSKTQTAAGSGAGDGQRHGWCAVRQRYGSGIMTAAAAVVHRPRQKAKKMGRRCAKVIGGCK